MAGVVAPKALAPLIPLLEAVGDIIDCVMPTQNQDIILSSENVRGCAKTLCAEVTGRPCAATPHAIVSDHFFTGLSAVPWTLVGPIFVD